LSDRRERAREREREGKRWSEREKERENECVLARERRQKKRGQRDIEEMAGGTERERGEVACERCRKERKGAGSAEDDRSKELNKRLANESAPVPAINARTSICVCMCIYT